MSVETIRQQNLGAMEPSLAARLAAPLNQSRIGTDEAGATTWTRFRRPLVLTDAHCMNAVTHLSSDGPPVLLIGLGSGQRLAWLLAHTRRTVFTWDPDHALWNHVLGIVDGADALRSGRWVPILGPDLLHCEAARQAEALWHPDFAAAYADAESMLRPEGPVALVLQGELYVDDVACTLRDLGWRVFRWDLFHLPREEQAHILSTSGAALAVAINTQEGLTEALAAHRIPFAVWEIDPNTTGPAVVFGPSDNTVVFTYRRANFRSLGQAGYRHVEHLPLAAPTHRYQPAPQEPSIPIAFVGASMAESGHRMQQQLRDLFATQPSVLAALERIWAIQRQDPSRWQIPQLLDTICPGLRARVRREEKGLDLAVLMGEVSAAEKRLSWLAPLGPLGLQVWGDAGWSLVKEHGVEWKGWADHFVDLPRIYRTAAIHVDVPRLYQMDAVAMRVFDVLAAGGFLIAEHSPELVQLFTPGVEIETYRTPAELRDKCRFYLTQPGLRARIARAGSERVHRDHSMRARVQQILDRMPLGTRPSGATTGG